MDKSQEQHSSDELNAFRKLAATLVRVPKSEVDRKESEYQRQQAKKPKRGPKPKHK